MNLTTKEYRTLKTALSSAHNKVAAGKYEFDSLEKQVMRLWEALRVELGPKEIKDLEELADTLERISKRDKGKLRVSLELEHMANAFTAYVEEFDELFDGDFFDTYWDDLTLDEKADSFETYINSRDGRQAYFNQIKRSHKRR